MKHVVAFTFLISSSVFAKPPCFTDEEIKGRYEMVQNFRHQKNEYAVRSYEKFCKENAEKVTCATKTVPAKEQKAATSELMKGKSCGQTTLIKNNDDTVTLYFFDYLIK
jgi:hypothetical protein